MLQQTRVEAAIPYFEKFLQLFPTLRALAEAEENAVLAAWSGLGYYSRARNLHKAAKKLSVEGIPAAQDRDAFDQLRGLPGVGPYTAAAVASIALGLPHAVLDGNVMRVISRVAADPGEVSAPGTRRRFGELADQLLDRRRPGDFNQAMMELGATVCVPRSPACAECPVSRFCAGRAAGIERELPVKKRAAEVREVALELVVLQQAGEVFLVRRAETESRLAGFWELPEKRRMAGLAGAPQKSFTHQIVNDRFRVNVWHTRRRNTKTERIAEGRWVPLCALGDLPVTTITKKALQALGLDPPIPSRAVGV